ncbi:MAG: glycosyltransferase, partial [Planctomycetes bacterium]|nr:glycosyltransferase [Planctomycetota bacterium]
MPGCGEAAARPALRVAYLNSRYPSLSHTFIEREIRALRFRGIEVHPCSVRPPGAHDLLGGRNREAAAETYTLFEGKVRLLRHAALAAARHPWRFLRTQLAAQALAPPGAKARAKHAWYALEAARLARELARRGVRHVHVHMANNGAAVGLLASVFDPALGYSLTIHGSEEFFNIESVRLRQKTAPARFVRCVSEFTRSQVMAWTPTAAWQRYHVVRCGIDLAEFPLAPLASGDELRLLVVARLDPIKGLTVLFEACRLLQDSGVRWRLEVVGDGPMRGEFENAAARAGIAAQVAFTGAVAAERIREHLERAHV